MSTFPVLVGFALALAVVGIGWLLNINEGVLLVASGVIMVVITGVILYSKKT